MIMITRRLAEIFYKLLKASDTIEYGMCATCQITGNLGPFIKAGQIFLMQRGIFF